MKHKRFDLMLFTVFGFLFLWLDVLIGHASAKFQNPFMWLPVVVLPVSCLLALLTAFRCTDRFIKIVNMLCALVILIGLIGFGFHLHQLMEDFHGTMQWEIMVRLMRYPPLMAPIAISGLGVLGLLANREQ